MLLINFCSWNSNIYVLCWVSWNLFLGKANYLMLVLKIVSSFALKWFNCRLPAKGGVNSGLVVWNCNNQNQGNSWWRVSYCIRCFKVNFMVIYFCYSITYHLMFILSVYYWKCRYISATGQSVWAEAIVVEVWEALGFRDNKFWGTSTFFFRD